MIVLLLYIMGIGTLLINIFEPRTFIFLDNTNLYTNQLVTIIGRITTALFLIACTIGIVYGLFRRKHSLPSQGILITVAGLFLYSSIILSALVSENGGFTYKLFFFPLFIITAYLSPRFNPIQNISKILPILLVFIYTSLIAIFLNPTWAYSSYSDSWIGIPIRLYGTSNHPNGLGYIALSYLILARLVSKKSLWFYINIIVAIITIILTQSKTIWLALIIWLILEWIIKNVSTHRLITSRMLISAILLFFFITLYLLLFKQDLLEHIFGSNISLTGRTYVWEITLKTWLKHPIFGYGPNLWNINFRQKYALFWAGQAHNQFMQTLGESGLIGVGALLFYLFTIIKLSSKLNNVTNFASLGIVITILIRSFFETPLNNTNIDEGFFIHAIFFVILINSESLLESSQKEHL